MDKFYPLYNKICLLKNGEEVLVDIGSHLIMLSVKKVGASYHVSKLYKDEESFTWERSLTVYVYENIDYAFELVKAWVM